MNFFLNFFLNFFFEFFFFSKLNFELLYYILFFGKQSIHPRKYDHYLANKDLYYGPDEVDSIGNIGDMISKTLKI